MAATVVESRKVSAMMPFTFTPISRAAVAFCAAMREGGYEPMIYGNTYDLERMRAGSADGCPIWCAEYDGDPSYQGPIRVWQYASDGVVAGIDTLVDMNLDLGDVPVP